MTDLSLQRLGAVLMTDLTSLLLSLFIVLPAAAGVTNRIPLTPVEISHGAGGGSFAVVAGADGWFLADRRRIDPAGRLVDVHPIPGVFGQVVAWEDGWLLFQDGGDEIVVRRLGRSGLPVIVTSFPSEDRWLVDVESGHGHIALVEDEAGPGTSTWITHRTLERIVHLQRYPQIREVDLTVTAQGFRFVAQRTGHDRDARTMLFLWDLDASGRPVKSHSYDSQVQVIHDQLQIVASRDSTMVVAPSFEHTRFDVVSPSLEIVSTLLATRPQPNVTVALPHPDGFFVSYSTGWGATEEWRAKIISFEGKELEDIEADPISGADAEGERYFVMRPWREGAIAAGDPRTIVSPPVHLPTGDYRSYRLRETVVSGDVTLALIWSDRLMFRRVDASATPIDANLIPVPDAADVTAIPEGFAFLLRDVDTFYLRRLSARGAWIDSYPIELFQAPFVSSADISGGSTNLVVAWAGMQSVQWQSFTLNGVPQGSRHTMEHPPYADSEYGAWPHIDLYSSGSDRLLVLNYYFECHITCSYPDLPVHAIALDAQGTRRGGITTFDPHAYADAGTHLSDGSWLLSVRNHGLARLAPDGRLLDREPFPEAVESFIDLEATSSGWRASDDGGRVYDFHGSHGSRMLNWVSAEHVTPTMLGSGDVILFSAHDQGLRTLRLAPTRVYAALLSGVPGDVSLELVRAWRNETVRAEVEVTNRTPTATTVVLRTHPREGALGGVIRLAAGETRRVIISPPGYGLYAVEAAAPETEDHDPSNNVVIITEEDLSQPRRRGTRR